MFSSPILVPCGHWRLLGLYLVAGLCLLPVSQAAANPETRAAEEDVNPLAAIVENSIDREVLAKMIDEAPAKLDAFMASLEQNPAMLEPFEKDCKAFDEAAQNFSKIDQGSADNKSRLQAAAEEYLRIASKSVADLEGLPKLVMSQLGDYALLDENLSLYFKAKPNLSKPLFPETENERTTEQKLRAAKEKAWTLIAAIQEDGLLKIAATPEDGSEPGGHVPTTVEIVTTRIKELHGLGPCRIEGLSTSQ